ncbi:seminase-like [Lucilia cuprina]|uniref:seminase-like n=1 Tax=Lucilia cuprina TaxID=7375 RepID=UPI001F06F90C|nr:seminase-like [Lucilia cuprina]
MFSLKISVNMAILILLYSLILALVLPTKTLFLNVSDQSSRIVNGKVTTIDKAKFVVNLRSHGHFSCGGSLVAPKIVLTAAHCVNGLRASELTIIGGATYLSERGIKRSVFKIYIPKEYNSRTMDMDIALLILSKPLEGANISIIKLCKTKWNVGDEMTVYGWGQITEVNKTSSNQLRTVKVPVIKQKKCSDMYKGHEKITNSMFCAGDLKGKDACTGDSGGPAVYKNQLCGVVSWGTGCARKNFPGVYANIIFAREYIDKIMKNFGSY